MTTEDTIQGNQGMSTIRPYRSKYNLLTTGRASTAATTPIYNLGKEAHQL